MTPTDAMDISDDGQRRSQSRKIRDTSSSQNNGATTIESVLNTLQPLRDLAQNWDVDIASWYVPNGAAVGSASCKNHDCWLVLMCDIDSRNSFLFFACSFWPAVLVMYVEYSLEEYLEELTSLRLEGEGQPHDHHSHTHRVQHGTSLAPNFAQAALLLQNSSNVYSRKVEYLYSLVYKALDEFFKETSVNKNSSSSSSSRRKSADASIDDFFNFDPHVEFLLLDDVVPVELDLHNNKSSKIDLPPTLQHDDTLTELGGSGDARTPSTNQSLMLNRTRLSLGGLSVTRVDRSATRISTGSGPGFSGPSSSQQRALLGTLNSGSLRLVDGRCDIGEDGVLLMPGSSSGPTSCPAQAIASLAGSIERLPIQHGLRLQVGLGPEQPSDTMQPMELDYDNDDDGPGFYFAGDDDDAGDITAGAGVEGDAQATGARAERPRVTFPDEPQQSSPKRQANKVDPWSLLDPHVVDKADYKHNKPLRKGKTYLLPSGFDEPPSQCVTGASTRRVSSRLPTQPASTSHRRDSISSLCFTAQAFRATLHRRNHRNSLDSVESGSSHTGAPDGRATSMWQVRPPLTGLAFGTEFEYIAKETAKRRAAEMRESRKQGSEHHQSTTEQQHQDEQDQYDDDDDYGGGFDFGGDDDGDDRDYVGTNDGLGNNAGVASLADAFSSVGVEGQGGEAVFVWALWRIGICRTQSNPLDFFVAQNQNPTLDQKRLRSCVERTLKLLPRVPKNMHSVLS
jgi:hypothetical protein